MVTVLPFMQGSQKFKNSASFGFLVVELIRLGDEWKKSTRFSLLIVCILAESSVNLCGTLHTDLTFSLIASTPRDSAIDVEWCGLSKTSVHDGMGEFPNCDDANCTTSASARTHGGVIGFLSIGMSGFGIVIDIRGNYLDQQSR